MKKIIFMMFAMLSMAISMNAQNYAGASKFTDNWSVTLQGGVLTTMDNFFAGHTAMTPVVVIGADKYVTPWLGFGVEGRTSIGTGEVGVSRFNSHTAFDAVNVSGYAKVNLANLFAFNGTRRFFEPVVYTGLGWGHANCSAVPSLSDNYAYALPAGNGVTVGVPTEDMGVIRNCVTYRAGVECNFNLGKQRAWAVVVNPSVVWGNIDNGRLCKANGNFEITAGVVYHFKTSNGTHSYAKAHLYDAAEVARLNDRIRELENRPVQVVEKRVEVPATASTAVAAETVYQVGFAQNSAELTETAKAILDKVPTNATVNVAGSTSPEGTVKRNTTLAVQRAQAVADYLKNRGVTVNSVEGGAAGRAATVTVQK